jgi:uncharacterized membrane protein HdeD (DUF308 family)
MNSTNPVQDIMQHAMKSALSTHWRLFLFQGIIMLVLGILAVIVPMAAALVIAVFVGWLLLISGIVGLIAIFSTRHMPAFVWGLVTAALSIVVGALLIWNPLRGVVTLTIVLTAFFIVEGVFQVVTAFAFREVSGHSLGWMLVSGIADLVLAVIIIAGWPVSAVWAIGLLVGINLITTGWATLIAAFAGRALARATGAPAMQTSH